MRVLQAAVIVMGIMIVAGVAVLAVMLMQRVVGAGGAPAVVALDEPAGTTIVSAATQGDRMTLLLRNGGPDRTVVLDLRSGKIVGRAGLVR